MAIQSNILKTEHIKSSTIMDRIQMDAKLQKLSELLYAIHSQKTIAHQAKDFHVIFTQLASHTKSVLQKHGYSFSQPLRTEYEDRIKHYEVVLSALQSVINDTQQFTEMRSATNDAKLLYESVLKEYTVTYSTYNNADEDGKMRITEEMFLPHYVLINFLKSN